MGNSTSLPAKQSEELPGSTNGQGLVHKAIGGPVPKCGKFGAEIDNLYKMFELSASKYPTNNCFGKRVKGEDGKYGPFEWISYETVLAQSRTVGSGIASLGIKSGNSLGIYSSNRIEWQLAALGGWSQGLVCVPIYDTLGDNTVMYEINHAEITCCIVEKSKLANVTSVISKCKSLKAVVQLEPLGDDSKELVDKYKAKGITLTDWATMTKAGAETPLEPKPSDGDSLAFIMYTSGTTGDPKGVCLRQNSIVVAASYNAGMNLTSSDRYLSYLPLAHIFETAVEHGVLSTGGSVGFFSGDIKLIMDDIQTLSPTLFCGVPRIYQRVYDKAMATINGKKPAIAKFLNWALQSEIESMRKDGSHTIWNAVFQKVFRPVMGGSVRIMISGAAPLPTHVQEFLLATMGCVVVQGYGMTESSANGTLAIDEDYRTGHVGPPMATTAVKLMDVPEMNYRSSNDPPTGEVCMQGEVIFSHYHKNKEATNETIIDGWLHTGDIGRWNPDGTLSIIDRKKNIFKLAQGEYVAAEKIEMALGKSPFIGQSFVYGSSFFTMLVAVIVPDLEALFKWAKEKGLPTSDKVQLCADEQVKALLLAEVKAMSKEAKLKGFEVPKDVFVEGNVNELGQGFTIENDCLTPTFKLRRPQLLARYKKQVDAMYTGLGEDVSKAK